MNLSRSTRSRRPGRLLVMALALAVAVPLVAAVKEPIDLDAIYRIKEEGFQRSQVMDLMSYSTDVYGPRLTGSPHRKPFVEWVQKTFKEWGLSNIQLHHFGPFGRGWSNERFHAHVVSGQPFPLIGLPKAWTPGTKGTVRGEAVLAVIQTEEDFAKYRGKLKGRFVLSSPNHDIATPFEPFARRLTDADLAERAKQPDPAVRPAQRPGMPARGMGEKVMRFYLEEGVLAVLDPGRGSGGTFVVGRGGSPDPKAQPVPPQVSLAAEHYNRIARMLERDIPVTIEMNVENRFHDDPQNTYNILADIPGTDKADEIVLLGGHWDSWHGGTGAADNAAGFVAMMEAMRILKASGLKMRRTVRVALWDGEEQGLLGSRAYVNDFLADRTTMALKPGHSKFSVYLNIDNGTGAIRGVQLQGNEAIAPVFEQWMKPFRNMGVDTLSIRSAGGTDHLAFDAVGLPGFQFIQDPVEYGRTYHSNMDVYERIVPGDMMHNAVVVAAFAYHAANREELLPRKPLPRPQRQTTTW
jgi:carboxypeptidase Q